MNHEITYCYRPTVTIGWSLANLNMPIEGIRILGNNPNSIFVVWVMRIGDKDTSLMPTDELNMYLLLLE